MEEKDKLDFLWKIISRYDFYYGSVNNKATVILAFNVFVLTGIATNYSAFLPDFNKHIYCFYITLIFLVIAAISSIVSIAFTFKVLSPYLKSHIEPTRYLSNVFFGHVCQHAEPKNYIENMSKLDSLTAHDDLCKQAHSLAQGINGKFINIKHAISAILFLIIPALLGLIVMKIIISNLN